MKLKLHIGLWALIIMNVYKSSNSGAFNWTAVEPYMYALCNAVGDCLDKGKPSSNQSLVESRNVCCRECTEYSPSPRELFGYTKCLTPTIGDGGLDRVQYRFVVDAPESGCVPTSSPDNITEHLSSCDPNAIVAPWGNFYPVYSGDKQMNFVNEQCARCHGAKQIRKWGTLFLYTGQRNKVFDDLSRFSNTIYSSDFFLSFEAPNMASKDYIHVCFKVNGECREGNNNFYVDERMNLSRAEIRQACEEGETSLFIKSVYNPYKNVFCAICNKALLPIKKYVACAHENQDDAKRTPGSAFVSLLNVNYIEDIQLESTHEEDRDPPMVCIPDKSISEDDGCRVVHCPALQVRYTDGVCGYQIEMVYIDTVIIDIILTTKEELTAFNAQGTNILSVLNEYSPWSNFNCAILFVLRRIDIYRVENSELCITIACKTTYPVNTRPLLHYIKQSLAKPWILVFEQEHRFTQRLSPYSFMGHPQSADDEHRSGKARPSWVFFARSRNISFPDYLMSTWEQLIPFDTNNAAILRRGNTLFINKLFFCNQIYLTNSEYKFSFREAPLYMTRTDTYLRPKEYISFYSSNGNHVVSTCVEDTDLIPDTGNNHNASLHVGTHIFLYVNFCCILVLFQKSVDFAI